MGRQDKKPEQGTVRRVLRDVARRAQHPDNMDRIMQEAQDANMLHGELGRTLRGDYEAHRQSIWMQRGGIAVIIALAAGMVGAFLRLPAPLYWAIIGTILFVAAACFLLGWSHLFRWIGSAYGPPLPDQPDTTVALEDRPDKGNGDSQDVDGDK